MRSKASKFSDAPDKPPDTPESEDKQGVIFTPTDTLYRLLMELDLVRMDSDQVRTELDHVTVGSDQARTELDQVRMRSDRARVKSVAR